ncbi:hypothetical protein HT746_11705 [Burkholderia pyrrocinia]|nr:hypothetical protein [Burkholderia pyrrocinia]NTX27787.1 hypothetical protein [Burkholderia pyrrocinia]
MAAIVGEGQRVTDRRCRRRVSIPARQRRALRRIAARPAAARFDRGLQL